MKSVFITVLIIIGAQACDTLDLSEASCSASAGQCYQQCRQIEGPAQMPCEDRCRAEEAMCRSARN